MPFFITHLILSGEISESRYKQYQNRKDKQKKINKKG
jgi:hypothetical protein